MLVQAEWLVDVHSFSGACRRVQYAAILYCVSSEVHDCLEGGVAVLLLNGYVDVFV